MTKDREKKSRVASLTGQDNCFNITSFHRLRIFLLQPINNYKKPTKIHIIQIKKLQTNMDKRIYQQNRQPRSCKPWKNYQNTKTSKIHKHGKVNKKEREHTLGMQSIDGRVAESDDRHSIAPNLHGHPNRSHQIEKGSKTCPPSLASKVAAESLERSPPSAIKRQQRTRVRLA